MGPSAFDFTVDLSHASSSDVTVIFDTGNGLAVEPEDFIGVTGGSLLIPAGETSGTISIQANGDTKYENNEDFIVFLTGAAGGLIGSPSNAQGFINNDDQPPTPVLPNQAVTETNSGPHDPQVRYL